MDRSRGGIRIRVVLYCHYCTVDAINELNRRCHGENKEFARVGR